MLSLLPVPLLEEEPGCGHLTSFHITSSHRSSKQGPPVVISSLPFCCPLGTGWSCVGFSSGSNQIQGFAIEKQHIGSGIIYLNLFILIKHCSSMSIIRPELLPQDFKQDTSAVLLLCYLGLSRKKKKEKYALCWILYILDSRDFGIIEISIKY